MAERLWKRAESDLFIKISGMPGDPIIWEHSTRVAKLCETISLLPELSNRVIDRSALQAAALYHDMGWVLQVISGELNSRDLLLKPTDDLQRKLAMDWVLEHLSGLLDPGTLRLAAQAIRQTGDRQSDLLEAQVLTEANNLDEIGPQAIWQMLRKQLAEGKKLIDTVTAWQRQEEYHYWQARIKECFRFPSVRTLAQNRLQALRRFMSDLQASIRLEDLSAEQSLPYSRNSDT